MALSKLDEAPVQSETAASVKITLEPLKDNEEGVVIQLQGMLTIENVEEIYQKTEMALTQFAQVKIELREVEEIDLAVVQLFFFLQVLAEEGGNQLSFDHQTAAGTDELIHRSGLELYPTNK